MKTPEIIELQDDNSVEHQKQLIVVALPSFEAVLVFGRRSPDHKDKEHFISCSMTPHELVNELLNAMLLREEFAVPMMVSVAKYVDLTDKPEA